MAQGAPLLPPTIRGRVAAAPRPGVATVPTFRFDSLVLTEPSSLARRRSATAAVSIVVHAVLIMAVILLPLFREDLLPASDRVLRAFFVSPVDLAPPPPPPPPPAIAAGARPRVKAPAVIRALEPARFTAPIEVPDHLTPDAPLDLGVEGGVPGGVEGGVPGGVVGGIVGGLPREVPEPAPPALRIGGKIKPPRRIHAVQPVYPLVALQARVTGVVVIDAHVGVDGRVVSARVISGNPLLQEAALEAVRQWRYEPLLLNGVPMEFLLALTVEFRIMPAAAR